MSELQIALLGLGAALVGAVLAYNAWQARQHRRQAESLLPKAETTDVLMAGRDDVRSEPGFGDAPAREPTIGPNEPPRRAAPADAAGDPAAAADLPAEWADGRVDCLLHVEFVNAVPAADLWAEQANWSGTLDKPLQWLGLDGRTARWRALLPQDTGSVTQLAAALQLVDRRGPLSEAALGTYLGGVREIAQRYSGLVELPEPAPVLARARELDAFCAALDLQLSLLLLPRQGSLSELPGAKLKPLLDTAGLRLEGERFVAVDADGAEVFALVCQAAAPFSPAQIETAGLTGLGFSLDVPRVTDGLQAFERMLAVARQIAEALGAQLADAQRKPLAEGTIAAIRSRIGELQSQMAQAGFPPGSVRALRLFS